MSGTLFLGWFPFDTTTHTSPSLIQRSGLWGNCVARQSSSKYLSFSPSLLIQCCSQMCGSKRLIQHWVLGFPGCFAWGKEYLQDDNKVLCKTLLFSEWPVVIVYNVGIHFKYNILRSTLYLLMMVPISCLHHPGIYMLINSVYPWLIHYLLQGTSLTLLPS